MSIDLFESATECGCAAKMPAWQLASLLHDIRCPDHPNVVIGPSRFDDAGAYRLTDNQYLVQTVDFFPPVARYAKDYGRIAAANALSDVYAMGANPLCALAIVALPNALATNHTLRDIMTGACDALAEADCALMGGHTILDSGLKFGMAVTGSVTPGQLLQNSTAKPGDVLLLTKPVGTGVTVMAVKAGRASPQQERDAYRCMATLNRLASRAALDCDLSCATDITGFGVLGHSLQVARASGVSLEIGFEGIALLDNALTFASEGLLSAAAYANRDYAKSAVTFDSDVSVAAQDLLFDPQTSGGLLLCCSQDKLERLLTCASAWPYPCAVIGRVVEAGDSPHIRVRKAAFRGA